MSAKGRHDDWDFTRGFAGAVAGTFPSGEPGEVYEITGVSIGSEDTLLFETTGGGFVLHGDDDNAYIAGK